MNDKKPITVVENKKEESNPNEANTNNEGEGQNEGELEDDAIMLDDDNDDDNDDSDYDDENSEEDGEDDDNDEQDRMGSSTSTLAMFSTAEILSLKLLFAIMDQDGDEYIEKEELSAYAEESGDYAQKRELDNIIEALDSDGDGRIGLLDFVLFAARCKELSVHSKFERVISELQNSLPLRGRTMSSRERSQLRSSI
jgi:cobalamin biosynthesis protein CobT